ncbi:hypothetical protein [Methanobacterium sp.]|uniref:hypothetical protein n=1 Tax=Methanobacterium sp. TaxID=2164 RepID=UPI003C732B47
MKLLKNCTNIYTETMVTTHVSSTLMIYGSFGNLKQKKNNIMVFDRMFLDFDVDNIEANKIKKELLKLRSQGLNYKKSIQKELQEKLRKLIIEEGISKSAIE